MTFEDKCSECGELLDITKRLYRGPNDFIRCAVCQIIAEMRLEIARISAIVELMADVGEGRKGVH